MQNIILQNLGLVGSIIFALAYIPQITHLLKTKDSTGISIVSWSIWLFGAVLLLIYAIHLGDIVFLVLTTAETISLATTIILTIKYQRKV